MDGVVFADHTVDAHRQSTAAGRQCGEQGGSSGDVRPVRQVVEKKIPDHDQVDFLL